MDMYFTLQIVMDVLANKRELAINLTAISAYRSGTLIHRYYFCGVNPGHGDTDSTPTRSFGMRGDSRGAGGRIHC